MTDGWREHAIGLDDGTLVVFEKPGPDRAAPVILLLHGFTGCHLGWDRTADHLAWARVLAPDLPGHGSSRFADEGYACRIETASDLLRRALDRLEVPRCTLAGYSMGGRLALHLALSEPRRVERLVLESASPGLATEAERTARRALDEALADSIERDGVDAFLSRWQSTPVLASQKDLPAALRGEIDAERSGNRASGLAASLRSMGTGAQPWLGDRLRELEIPVTLVAGRGDAKFSGIATDMAATIRGARLEILPAGHNVHLEHPRLFASLLSSDAATQDRGLPAGTKGEDSGTSVRIGLAATMRANGER